MDFKKTSIDIIFKRGWFDDEDVVLEILSNASQNTLDHIRENRRLYTPNIQRILNTLDEDYLCSKSYKLGIEVVELTDKERARIDLEDKKKNEAIFEKRWLAHKPQIPERPLMNVDDKADKCWEELLQVKKNLHDYVNLKKKTYISPSQRTKASTDSKELELEEKVKQKENEFANAEKDISEADDEYYNEKKREFRKETLFKLFEKTNNTYNM